MTGSLKLRTLFLIYLIGTGAFPLFSQNYQAYFDEPAKIIYPQGLSPAGVGILIPYTTGTSDEWYRFLKKNGLPVDYVWILPQGRPQRSHYLPDFVTYVKNYEKIVLRSLKRVKEELGFVPAKRVLMGYSLGGDLSWALSNRNPDFFTHAVVMGSRCSYPFEPGEDKEKSYYFAIGASDALVRKNGMALALQKALDSGISGELQYYQGGHQLPPESIIRRGISFFQESLEDKDTMSPELPKEIPLEAGEVRVTFLSAISQGISQLYYLPPGKTEKADSLLLLEYPLKYKEELQLILPSSSASGSGSLVAETTSGVYIKDLGPFKDGDTIKMTIFSKTYRW